MNYCKIEKNDIAAAPGISVTVFVSGCHHHCPGCHNPEAWDFEYGKKWTITDTFQLIRDLRANGIKRNLCFMGGEPLDPMNRECVMAIIMDVKHELPDIQIYIWTGYTWEELQEDIYEWPSTTLPYIFNHINYLIDGRYMQEERDITLFMRGSRNQRILELKNGEINSIIK